MPVAVVTADIILLPILVAGIAVAIAVIEYLDLSAMRRRAESAEADMEWWAGLFLRLTAQLIKEDGYEIEVKPEGEIKLIPVGKSGDYLTRSEAPGKLGAKQGEAYRRGKQKQTGQQADDKKGESMADHDDLFGSTRPTSILSGLRGPETKKRGKFKFKFTPYDPFDFKREDIFYWR